MQDFVRGLFQSSPDLRVLTHAKVRMQYLAQIGQEDLTKEEKVQLKQLVNEQLLQIQVDDSPSDKGLSSDLRLARQKRPRSISEDETEHQQEQKKQRTRKELVSSDEEDSGIDSKKKPVSLDAEPTRKFSFSSDQADSGAEGHPEESGSDEQSTRNQRTKPPRKTSREASGGKLNKGKLGERRKGSESEERQWSDVEEVRDGRKATKDRKTEVESVSEQELKDSRIRKRRGFEREQKQTAAEERKGNAKGSKIEEQKGAKETSSEDECLSKAKEMCRKKSEWRAGDKEEEASSRKAAAKVGQRAQMGQEKTGSGDESGSDSKTQEKVTDYQHRKKGLHAEESGSDLDEVEDKSGMKTEAHSTKTRGTNFKKRSYKSDSDSEEEEEEIKQQVRRGRTSKPWSRNTDRHEREKKDKCSSSAKMHGPHKSRRIVHREESENRTSACRGSEQKKETWRASSSGDTSQSEAEEREKGKRTQSEAEEREKGKRNSPKGTVTSDRLESGSEETEGVDCKQKRLLQKRGESKDTSESESSQEEKEPRKRGREKSLGETIGGMESDHDSKNSDSESVGKKKRKGQAKKRVQNLQRRSSSKDESHSNSDDEEEHSHSADKDESHFSKRHQGKDKGRHSGKGDDHPSIWRLKRYIRECGVRKNYKKLLAGCRSNKAQVRVLKEELESLGVEGPPTLAKCKSLKKKREEAAEMASLDVGNIITTEGRPRRRNVWSLYSKPQGPSSSPEESPIRRPPTDWSHLRGLISSDEESN